MSITESGDVHCVLYDQILALAAQPRAWYPVTWARVACWCLLSLNEQASLKLLPMTGNAWNICRALAHKWYCQERIHTYNIVILASPSRKNNTMASIIATTPNFHPDNCTLATCPLSYAYLTYQLSLAGNALFLAIFSLLLPLQLILFIRLRTTGVSITISISLILEIIGYTGRVMMRFDPFSKGNFLMYLIPLTIAPVFLAAAVYLCLARIVVVCAGERSKGFSLLEPRMYTVLFVCCDFVSLVLQAAGGAIAALAEEKTKVSWDTGHGRVGEMCWYS